MNILRLYYFFLFQTKKKTYYQNHNTVDDHHHYGFFRSKLEFYSEESPPNETLIKKTGLRQREKLCHYRKTLLDFFFIFAEKSISN